MVLFYTSPEHILTSTLHFPSLLANFPDVNFQVFARTQHDGQIRRS